MRLCETTRELNYDSFVDTFGKQPVCNFGDTNEDCKRRNDMLAHPIGIASTVFKTPVSKKNRLFGKSENGILQTHDVLASIGEENRLQRKETAMEKMSKNLRKISLRTGQSRGSTSEDTRGLFLRRSKSASILGKALPSIDYLTPNFIRLQSRAERSHPLAIPTNSSPMSKLNYEDHRGYLSAIHNERNIASTRYWCLLADSCLYCYSSKDQHFATDVIALGGYRIARPETQSSIPYAITLERPGKQRYTFYADNAKCYRKWMVALSKSLSTNSRSPIVSCITDTTNILHRKPAPVLERSVSYDSGVAKSRAELLEIVREQQKNLLRERQAIETLTKSSANLEHISFLLTNKTTASSMASLTQSEDHGYSSSAEVFEREEYRRCPSARSQRSMSATSFESNTSLFSIPEEENTPDVLPKLLAEIEEFRAFSHKTLLRKDSKIP